MRALWAAVVMLPCVGCVAFDLHKDAPAPGNACQVHTTWENRVLVTADAVHDGAPLPGLAGRLYLFGPELGRPVAGDGRIVVDLLDVSHPGPDGQPKWLERFDLDPASVKQLLRKDFIGWGYTLFLPWSTYRPDITRVQLKVAYIPEKGTPLHAPISVVTLKHEAAAAQLNASSLPLTAPAAPTGPATTPDRLGMPRELNVDPMRKP